MSRMTRVRPLFLARRVLDLVLPERLAHDIELTGERRIAEAALAVSRMTPTFMCPAMLADPAAAGRSPGRISF
jgi:hypothetical protein